MTFRLRALGLHILASVTVLALILGTLYGLWYRWPGWYLADVPRVAAIMVAVDIVLGPLLTFIVAAPSKPRKELVRDVSVIVAVQLVALIYGTISLWNGRPLYYAFSENELQLVQAYDIPAEQAALGRSKNAALAPHWYSIPRWIFAPLPADMDERAKIISQAVSGGYDIVSMPAAYQPWNHGLVALRSQLKPVAELGWFSKVGKDSLAQKMRARGLAPEQANALAFEGRSQPLLAVFEPSTARLIAILIPDKK